MTISEALKSTRHMMVVAIFLSVVLSAPDGMGGVGSTGGGGAVVCRDHNGAITSAQLLDLYEAEMRGIHLRKSQGNRDDEYRSYVEALRMLTGDRRPVGANDVRQFHNDLAHYFSFTPPTVHLPEIDDKGPTPSIREGCAIEQLAIFYDDHQKIQVDYEIWGALDSLNQVALFAHEFIYYVYRSAGIQSSISSRKIVQSLFSLRNLDHNYIATSPMLRCGGLAINGKSSYLEIFQDPADSEKSVIQVLEFAGLPMFFPLRITLPTMIDKNKFSYEQSNEGLESTWVMDTSAQFEQKFSLIDEIFEGFQVIVRYRYNAPFAISLIQANGLKFQTIFPFCF